MVVVLALLFGSMAVAQPIADPMRPAGLAATAAEPAAAPRARADEAAPVWPQLQGVQVAPGGGSTALLDGRLVRLGERVGALTLVEIDARGVLLRGPRYEQRLSLTPGIAKTASAAPALPVNLAVKDSR